MTTNTDKALDNHIHFSNSLKTLISVEFVILMTAPIKDNHKIIGIQGMPFNIGH